MHRKVRAPAAVALAIIAAGVLAACLPPGLACPAIGYLSSVEVNVEGQFSSLEACSDSGCVSSSDEVAGSATLDEASPGVWAVTFHAGAPDELTVRAFDESGNLLAEDSFELDWTPVGDPGPCAGPVETSPVAFLIG